MPRPISARIHLEAISHNLSRARAHSPGSRVWAVVKANAYGHGIRHVYPALDNADGFALLDLDEAALLRELGWKGPILLLEGVFEPSDIAFCEAHDIWHTIHNEAQLRWMESRHSSHRHKVFLKLNGGMNRLGFKPELYAAAWERLQALPHVGGITPMMHFSDADGSRFGQSGIAYQMEIFAKVAGPLGVKAGTLSNSAAILRHGAELAPLSEWVRAGIMLYGGSPDYPEHAPEHWDLQPGMTLSSQLIAIQDIQTGDTVGYGSTFVAERPMRIGVVACGYADGYPRHAPTGTPILVDGVRTRTVGRVSMDMLTVDLSGIPQAMPGSAVTLWGDFHAPDGEVRRLPIDDVALPCGTVSYELMCALARRVPVSVD